MFSYSDAWILEFEKYLFKTNGVTVNSLFRFSYMQVVFRHMHTG